MRGHIADLEPATVQALANVVAARAPAFVAELRDHRTRALDLERWRASFAAAGWRLEHGPAERRADDMLGHAGVRCPLSVDQAARALLLLELELQLPPGDFVATLELVYRAGDTGERQAIMRALPLLRGPERFVPIAAEACRSSVLPVFEAIACENPFPAESFPEPAFNQLVLKAVFQGVSLRRVWGLEDRIDVELRRMAADYAAERRAARRPVPADLSILGVPL